MIKIYDLLTPLYTCRFCKTEYQDMNDAWACLESHGVPTGEIVGYDGFSNEFNCADVVCVKLSGERLGYYRLDRTVSDKEPSQHDPTE